MQLAQTDGSTRLVSNNGQTDTTSGRLEIYYRGLWGAVCDDDFSLTEAQVACREMGYADVNSYGNVVDLGWVGRIITASINFAHELLLDLLAPTISVKNHNHNIVYIAAIGIQWKPSI